MWFDHNMDNVNLVSHQGNINLNIEKETMVRHITTIIYHYLKLETIYIQFQHIEEHQDGDPLLKGGRGPEGKGCKCM